jgi:hypothetical protein
MRAFYEHLNKKGYPKIGYDNLEEAVIAANEETMRIKSFRMVPYLCSYCNKFHIGKPNYKV